MPTSRPLRLPLPGAKRQRHSTSKDRLTNRTASPMPPSEKTGKPFKSVGEITTEYWDELTYICLTQAALNELDRRAPRHRRITTEGQSGLSSKELSALLKRSCRHGGLDLRHLRGYSSLKAVNSALSERTEMPRVGTGDAGLGQHFIQHEIFPDDRFATKPQNWDELLGMVEQPRPVLTPPEPYDAQCEVLHQLAREVQTKRDIMTKIFPLVAGSSEFHSAGDHSFQNLEDLTNGKIVKVHPDIYDGADAGSLDPKILTELRSFIKPLAEKETPVVPNFFGVFKGPKSQVLVAEQQARYAGAIGARAIHKLRLYAADDPDMVFDNNAYTISAVYHYGTLSLYAHRTVKPSVPGGSIIYRMTLIRAFAIVSCPDVFRQGVTAFRNARGWAQRKRDECIAAANSKARGTTMTQSTATTQITATTSTSVPAPPTRPGCIPS